MYQVLLVDDEPAIREGLRTLVDWRQLGFAICGDAANGREGLEACGRLKPDVMLVDIRMPGIDGLQMIEEIRRLSLSCKVLILTGYSDFQYAKRAIDNQVDGYLLKPVDPDELQERLLRLRQKISDERAAMERLESSRSLEKEQLLRRMLTEDNVDWERPDNADWLSELKWPWKSCRVLLIGTEPEGEWQVPARRSLMARLRESIEGRGLGCVCAVDEYAAVLLKDVTLAYAKPLLEEASASVRAEFGQDPFVCAGYEVRRAGDVRRSYEAAIKLAKFRFLFRDGNELLIEGSECLAHLESSGGEASEDRNGDAEAVRLAYAIEAGNKSVIRELLEASGRRDVRQMLPEAEIKSRYAVLYAEVVHRLAHAGGGIRRTSNLTTQRQELNECRSLKSLLGELGDRLCELADAMQTEQPGGPLRGIIDFIQRHYDEDLKLETLAETFHYNSGYLGKLFKQQTGQSFNTYLDLIRIEKAKELLRQDYKVHQVASRVGFANVDYFHAKFRKYVGQSPSYYRENP